MNANPTATATETLRDRAGDLILDYDALELPADPGLTIITYTAEAGSPARRALDVLATWAATPGNTPTPQT